MIKEIDIDTLARTLYGEARGEDRQGKIAVACVVLNRIERKKMCGYETINGVRQPSVAQTCLKPWQFSCWNKNDPNRKIIIQVSPANKIFAECIDIADAVLRGEIADITKGATHYYNPKVCAKPKWAVGKIPCAIVGHHLFFNDID